MDGCIDENQAIAYVAGALSPAEVDATDEHAAACSDCRRLLSELVLSHGGQSSTILPPTPLPSVSGAQPPLLRGALVGRYLVLERLGAGGMGVVYAAFDPELDRRVALKLLRRSGAGETEARLRLLREAQTLARLSHPNVVTVHDLGTWGDQVFLAMELVDGWTLSTWLRERARTELEVVAALAAAGRGLVAAHAAGIVHRDFKPDNVMVGRDGRIRVTDFGLARASGADGEAPMSSPESVVDSSLTVSGAVLGTPRYMAPEQRSGRPADARSDQFSFCTTLAEALDGCGARSPRLQRILARGLAADPAARWPSMEALIAALEHDPRVRRRRALVAVAVVAAVAGAVLVPRWFEARRAPPCRAGAAQFAAVWNPERKLATRTAILAAGQPFAATTGTSFERTLDDYQRRWTAMHQEACEATRVAGHQTEEVLGLRMACLAARLDEASALVGLVARGETAVERVGPAASALSPVGECADVVGLSAPIKPPAGVEARARVDALRRELGEAKVRIKAGRYSDALARLLPMAAAARQLGYTPLVAEVTAQLGSTQYRLGQMKEAEQSFYDAAYAAEAGRHDDLAALAWLELIEVVGYGQDRPVDAHNLARQAEASIARLAGRRRDLEVQLHDALSGVAMREGNDQLAEEEAARSLALAIETFGPQSLQVGQARVNHGVTLRHLHRLDEALAEHQRALAIDEQIHGPDHPLLAVVHYNVATSHLDVGRLDEALVETRRALALAERHLGQDNVDVGAFLVGLGEVLSFQGDAAAADAAFARAVRVLEKALGDDHDDVADAHGCWSQALLRARRYDAALAEARRAVAIQEQVGAHTATMAVWLGAVGEAELGLGRPSAALPWLERALDVGAKAKATGFQLAAARFCLARALEATRGDSTRARALAQQAATGLADARDPSAPPLRRDVAQWLATRRSTLTPR